MIIDYFKALADVKLQKPVHATIFVTNICNARCPWCCYAENINVKVDEMGLEEYRKITPQLGKLVMLEVTGGEPFLRNDLASIIECFMSNCRPGLVLIPTNGIATAKIVGRAREILSLGLPCVSINISIDALGKA